MAGADVAAVVKDAGVVAVLAHKLGHIALEGVERFDAESRTLCIIGRIQARIAHHLLGIAIGRGDRLDDVEEEAVDGHQLEQLGHAGFEEIDVGRVDVQPAVEAGFERRRPQQRAIRSFADPLRMTAGCVVVPLHGDVNRRTDADLVAGFDLVDQQIGAFQMGVDSLRKVGRLVVEHAVMAAGETGDGIDVGLGQRAGKLIGIEVGSDAGDLLAGVVVEVDLAIG